MIFYKSVYCKDCGIKTSIGIIGEAREFKDKNEKIFYRCYYCTNKIYPPIMINSMKSEGDKA